MLYMVFDVETVGLHGEGFSVGYIVIDTFGVEWASGYYGCPPAIARGTDADREWARANIPESRPYTHNSPDEVRRAFWRDWEAWHGQGAILVADCAWPVEARFLADCVDDSRNARAWNGPYPLHDVATARLCAGLDPLATVERLPSEEPKHDPLADARQSARLWLEALKNTPKQEIA